MNLSIIEGGIKIERVEWAILPGERPRPAGRNARLDVHGKEVPLKLARITAGGVQGFGWSQITPEEARSLIGRSIREMFTGEGLVREENRKLEFPLLDWLGKAACQPVYTLFAKKGRLENMGGGLMAPCYDTSLYFDELHLQDNKTAIEFMFAEALEGKERGHRNFKMKVGRGARFMPLLEGIKRDIAVIQAVREAAGPEGKILIDANNGYNLNITKEVLQETRDAKVYWIEEAFHEDPVLYQDLKMWLREQELHILIADGEGLAAKPLTDWAKQGLVDVLQYDILIPGFSHWVELGKHLDCHHVKSSPHSYGTPYGNYPLAHLASAIDGFQFVEWDQCTVSGMDFSGYVISEGKVLVPDQPGFGLHLDDAYFSNKVKESGWQVYEE